MCIYEELLQLLLVGIGLTQRGEKLANHRGLWSIGKLFRDLVEKLGVLIHNLDDIIKVVRELTHVHSKFDQVVALTTKHVASNGEVLLVFMHRYRVFHLQLLIASITSLVC